MRIELTLDQMRASYDWQEAFKYAKGFLRDDVVEILGLVNGYNDGDEWVAVFRLADGRYAALMAGCDYTGWG